MKGFVDIEIYDENDKEAQGKYLVHGCDDVLWTNSIDQALLFLKYEIEEHNAKQKGKNTA